MKTIKSKKLIKKINTVCDFNTPYFTRSPRAADTGTDPTNTIVTTLTTISGFNIGKIN